MVAAVPFPICALLVVGLVLGLGRRTPAGARAPATLVQIQTGTHPCPYCGSTDTRLDNLFGPTPCRSIRYCNACRQPFEQFKTL